MSKQTNGETFSVSKIIYHTLNQFSRTQKPGLNDDYLSFTKIKVFLSQTSIEIYRNYTKFLDFLAGTTALTSNVLFFLIIVMNRINSVLAKHVLLKTIFSSNSLKNMGKFEKNFKEIFKNDQPNLTVK